MLKFKNLTVTNERTPILKNINFDIAPGEIHVITGAKFSGKSALAHAVTGHPDIQIESGDIIWKRKKLNKLSTEDRSKLGIFVSFQHPPDFDEITTWELFQQFFDLKQSEIEDLRLKYIAYSDLLELGEVHEIRELNAGNMTESHFKRNELIYMLLSGPKLLIIDEIEEGLADDEVELVGTILREYIKTTKAACLLVSRNQKFLDIINPTHVHLMSNGEIRMSGGPDLYKRIVEDEYSEFS